MHMLSLPLIYVVSCLGSFSNECSTLKCLQYYYFSSATIALCYIIHYADVFIGIV